MFSHISQQQWSVFWRKLENLLSGEMPLVDALVFLKKNQKPALVKQIDLILKNLSSGLAFYESVPQHYRLWRGILLAGERSGSLSIAVGRLADKLERSVALRSQIVSALIYPLMVVVMCLVVVFLLASLVVPRFEQLFRTLDIQEGLPALTVAIFGFSEFLARWGLLLGLLIAGIVAVLIWRRERWGAFYERVLKKIPLFGSLYLQQVGLDVLDNFSMLLDGGLSLSESLEVVADSTASIGAKQTLHQASMAVSEGDSLSQALGGADFWEASDIELLAIAQRSGRLKQSALKLAELLHERFGRRSALAVRMVEPILIAVMAAMVGVLLVGLFSPLMPLIGRLSEGGL